MTMRKPRYGRALLSAALLGLAACGDAGVDRGKTTDAALLVPVARVASADGYVVRREFAGRVEAARDSAVGFEIGGQLAAVLVDEGDRVAAGEVLARLDTERLEAREAEAVAALDQTGASLALAETTLARTAEALEFRGVSQQEYDEAVRAERAARSAREAARARLASVRVDLEKSVLRAPFEATVVRRAADEGEVLAPGQVLLQLQEQAPPRVRIGVAGDMLEAVAARDDHMLMVNGRALPARLRAVLPVRDAATRTVDALFELETAQGVLPGDLARLALERQMEAPGFWLPLGSLAEGDRGVWTNYVAVPLPAGESAGEATHVIEARTVEVLHEREDQVYVRGAIDAGERVVVEGLHRVVPGQTVRVGVRQALGEPEAE
jgi:RND family efflux transporter MFP subunit